MLKSKFFGFKEVYSFGVLLFIIFPYYFDRYIVDIYDSSLLVNGVYLVSTVVIYFARINERLHINGFITLKEKYFRYYTSHSFRFHVGLLFVVLLALSLITYSSVILSLQVGLFILTIFFAFFGNWYKGHSLFKLNFFLIIALLIPIITYFVLWIGFGRLVLAQFATGSLLVYSLFKGMPRWTKLGVVVCIPVLLLLGGMLRDKGASFEQVLLEGDGLGSVFSPMRDTERVFEDISTGKEDILYGYSYVGAFLFFIPREMWEGKPEGFGSTIVKWYMPGYEEVHSLAATYLAEAYANFGVLGYGMVLFLPFCYNRFTKAMRGRRSKNSNITLFLLIAFLCVIPDFIWGGVHSAIVRGAVCSLVFLYIGTLVKLLKL